MTPRTIVEELTALGVRLWEEDGKLRYRAPAGVLTGERRAALQAHKAEVMALLAAERAPLVTPRPAARHAPFPLTDVQAAYLVGRGEAFDYGGVGCHGYGELIFGELDVPRLQEAWNTLIARHDMLRAVVEPGGVQRVLPEVPEYVIDVAERPAVFTRGGLDHKVYDPGTWPLFTVKVSREPGHTVMHLSIDFLICDFVSIQILLDELAALLAGRPLEPLELTYRDYQEADRAAREGPRHDRDRAYWMDRLDDLPPAPDLPMAANRADRPRFTRHALTLSPAEWKGLRERAAGHGLTPSTAVLGAYAEVLAAWSAKPRFTLTVTLLNRAPLHPQANRLVGDFTSVNLLALDQDVHAPFSARAATLQATLWADLDHRLFSGVEVMREITRRRGGAAALMPVVFTSAIGLRGDERADRLPEPAYGISQTPQVWIDCQNIERGDGLSSTWDVRDGVFPGGLTADMFAAYENLLRALATGDEPWSRPDPVTLPEPQRRRRATVNATEAPLPGGLLHDGVLDRAARTPGEPAVVAADRTLTFGELSAHAAAVAGALARLGRAPGDLVAVVADKGWQQVVAVLGTLAAGCVYVPVDTVQPVSRRDAIITSAGIGTILTQRSLLDRRWPARALAVEDLLDQPGPEVAGRRVDPSAPAYVIHTSGSTGSPKGVVISHRAALNTVRDIDRRFGVSAADRVLGLANLGFDLSVYDLFGPPAAGGRLVLPAPGLRGSPAHWADLIDTHGVTLWNSVPAQLQMLHDYLRSVPARDLATLRLALVSGDWIPVPLPDAIRRRIPGLRVVGLGGATEAAIWSIFHPIGEVDPGRRSIPYGKPLANQTFDVLGPGHRPRPDWVPGELYIGGAGLADGYLNDPGRTAERFVMIEGQRLYRTGDLGRYLPDGDIEFLGREDFQVKIRGHRIELAEIETALSAHPDVAACAVVVDGEPPLGRRLTAFAEPARRTPPPLPPLTTGAADDLKDACERPAYLDYLRELDHLALAAMMDAFRAAGLFTPGARHDLTEIYTATGALPRHHRLIRRFLKALTGEGLLVFDGKYRAGQETPRTWPEPQEDRHLLDYFRSAATHLPALLRGEENATALLFPEGRLDVTDALYAGTLFNQWAGRTAGALVADLAARHEGAGPPRILEVGAGAGGVSAEVFAALGGTRVDHLYTDLSPFFLSEAARRFAGRDDVTYALFDLDRDPYEQGLAPGGADVIVAGDVLHATRDVPATLARLRELLAPGGWLVFVEMTRDHYQVMASLELMIRLDDDFADLRAGTDTTFLTEEQWRAVLAEAGGEVAACLPGDGGPLDGMGIKVFAVRFKAGHAGIGPDRLRDHLAERLPDYMLPAVRIVDELPRGTSGKIDRAALLARLTPAAEQPAATGGEEPRTELERRIAAIWADVLGAGDVRRDQDFFTLGGDSLQAAKLVGRMIEDLEQAASAHFDELLRHLLDHPTVAALAAHLTAHPAQNPAARPVEGPAAIARPAEGPAAVAGAPADASAGPAGAVPPAPLGGRPILYAPTLDSTDGDALDLLAVLRELGTVRTVTGGERDLPDVVAAAPRAEPVRVVGRADAARYALELARQLAEAGHDVAGLTLVEPVVDLSACPDPYAGDITLALAGPPEAAALAWWGGVCLGELRVHAFDPGDGEAVALREALR